MRSAGRRTPRRTLPSPEDVPLARRGPQFKQEPGPLLDYTLPVLAVESRPTLHQQLVRKEA